MKKTVFKTMKIETKLILFMIFSSVVILSLFYFFGRHFQNETLSWELQKKIIAINKRFLTLEQINIKNLSLGLRIFSEDQEIKNIFLEKDRDILYTAVAPIFEELNERHNVTHLYFYLPDKTVFLRLHDKTLFGDEVRRKTLLNAEKTKEISSGLELGKTAFALRSVIPYYNQDELIGYVELGREVDEFLDILKKEVGDDFAFFGKKELMDRGEWEKVMTSKEWDVRWGENETYAFLGSTSENVYTSCSSLELSRSEEVVVGNAIIEEEGRKYQCSSFPIYNFENERIGLISIRIDITDTLAFGKKHIIYFLLFLAGIFFVFLVSFRVIIEIIISSPLRHLLVTLKNVAQGLKNQKINVESGYEVSEISRAFNLMTEKIDSAQEHLEKQIVSRTKELEEVNTFLIGRELRMIELKKEIQRLKKEKEL